MAPNQMRSRDCRAWIWGAMLTRQHSGWAAQLPAQRLAARSLLLQALPASPERDFFIVNLLARTHLIVEMILVDRPCTMGV